MTLSLYDTNSLKLSNKKGKKIRRKISVKLLNNV